MKKKKKVVVIVPIKKNSKRVRRKNFRMVNSKPLYRYLLDKLRLCNFDEIYIDSDSKEIEKYCKKNNYKFIHRKSFLKKDSANGNDLLNYHSKIIDADIYFQLYVTAPLLKIKTINKCIQILKNEKKYDSILTANKIYTWFWFNNRPVNYNPKILPRSQDARPIVMETTGLYGIKKKSLITRKCRIGKKPYFFFINNDESVDLDSEQDFLKLNSYLKKK